MTHLVIGHTYGTRKFATARERGLWVLDEDSLFQLIRKSAPHLNKSIPLVLSISLSSPAPSQNLAAAVKEVKLSTAPTTKSGDVAAELWTDKYAPRSSQELIGNHGAISAVREFLTSFAANIAASNLAGDSKTTVPASKTFKRALLVSGMPGIGKSSSATIIGRELGYDVIQLNASDTRNKSSLHELLKMSVNTGITSFFNVRDTTESALKKKVIIHALYCNVAWASPLISLC